MAQDEEPLLDYKLVKPGQATGADARAPLSSAVLADAGGGYDDGQPSTGQMFAHGLGLGLRDDVQGLASGPLGMAYDVAAIPQNVLNWGVKKATGYDMGLGTKSAYDAAGALLDKAGVPTPETPREKIQSAIQQGGVGALSGVGLGAALQLPKVAALFQPGAGMVTSEAAPVSLDRMKSLIQNPAQEQFMPAVSTPLPATSAAPSIAQKTGALLADQPVRQMVTGGLAGGASSLAGEAGAPPWAQLGIGLGAGVLSGTMPGATSGFGLSKTRALAQLAEEKHLIPIADAQKGSASTKFLYDQTSKYPGSGGEAFARTQQDAYNAAIGRTFGAKTIDGKLTPEAMTAAYEANSEPFQRIAANTTIKFDPELDGQLSAVEKNLTPGIADHDLVQKQIDNIRKIAADNNGQIPSDWTVGTLGVKSPLSRGAANAGPAKGMYGDVKDALNEALERNASPDDVADLRQAQQNWKNMRTVDKLVAKGDGDVPPGSVTNAVAANKYQRSAYNPSDLKELGEIGKKFIKPPQSSGTSERGMSNLTMLELGEAGMAALHGDWGTAAAKAGGVVAPYIAAPVVNRALRGSIATGPGARLPPGAGQYYARQLLTAPRQMPPDNQ